MKLDHSLAPYTKINSKWMKDLNVRQDSTKILEENTGNSLFELGHSNFLQDTSMKARETKAKMNNWDFIKIKNFCTAKETVHKTTRQPTEWEKISANDLSDKGLVSKIYKKLIKLNSKETNNPIMKWAKDMNRNFRRLTHGQQAHEKMFHITCHQGNTNKNHNEVPPHTSENGENYQDRKQQVLERMWRKGNPLAVLVGMQTGAATLKKQCGCFSRS